MKVFKKVLRKILMTLSDFEDYPHYRFKGNKKKEKYDQLELDMDGKSKSPEKIAFFSNLKRDFIILVFLALVGSIFISINKNTKHATHLGTSGVTSIEFQNFGVGGGVSMNVDEKEDIKLIIDSINKIEKEKNIDVLTLNIEDVIEDTTFVRLIINYKNEKKESKIIDVRENKITIGDEEIATKSNQFSSLWYKLNYKVTNLINEK